MNPKILLRRGRKEEVDGRMRQVVKQHEYFVTDSSKDFGTSDGVIPKDALASPDGSVIKSKTDKEFIVYSAQPIDLYRRLPKLPQSMTLKDLGIIAAETGIGKDSVVIEGGSGSGHSGAFFARISKSVISYEIRDDHAAVSQENWASLGLSNITLKRASLYEPLEETGADLILLDVPEPWKALPHAAAAVKVGGYIVSYSPSITQAIEFVETAKADARLQIRKTVEILERLWDVNGKATHPKCIELGHTAFLTFVRRVQK